ncbi:peptide/nickel transport system permease protein [Mucilaginibacter pineti]|uniref:Peptide/nickel transport system permease protein n=1 Tax=Mucilaginibacter pineti TaxID=1391627 RepID=A0A1G7FL85_9SPHI|nr:ABC transporter permease [Mucilaginibacter pineti]SDE76646.1 peptide/nickel transport system permease protein [Mucilaginibacter pineti]
MAELTPSKRIWNAFKRNKFALAGLAFIALTLLVAILGYLIMPDQTPQANNMTIQLSIKRPGAEFMMLRIKKSEPVDTVGFFTKMLFGQQSFYREIPITNYSFKQDSIYVDEYIGDEDKPERKAYNIFEVISGIKPVYKNGKVSFCFARGNCRVYAADGGLYMRFWGSVHDNIEFRTYWLGTDVYGRDLLSRLLLGTRVSLAVGLMAVIISMLMGVTIGAIAGYFGGWIDAGLSWIMNILWSLPALLLVIAISFALGKGLWQIFIAVGLSMWVEVARLVRGQVMSLKQVEYIEAARALGFTNRRIITRHILPNITGPMLVMASSNFASAILLEAGLSFLGFGAQPPMPTWGAMIKEHYGYIVMDSAFLAIIPGLAIMLLVYAFNLVTVGLRDAFDIKSQSTRI